MQSIGAQLVALASQEDVSRFAIKNISKSVGKLKQKSLSNLLIHMLHFKRHLVSNWECKDD